MAKKKTSAAVATRTNPFELAAVVSDRVQISDVRILKSSTEFSTIRDIDDLDLVLTSKVRVEHSVNEDKTQIMVRPSFSLRGTSSAELGTETLLSISCQFLLVYDVTTVADIPDANLQAFAQLNGVYNSWPYWREYVQNMVGRMGLPRLVIPVFRFRK
jgi:preprotein translocase subunit SecB